MPTAAVVGCGDISVVHLQALTEIDGVDLVGVCDVDPATAAAVAERRGVPSFTDHRQLLRALQPEVVHVCTPHDQHAPVVLDSLEAGSHVLVEKPLAHRLPVAEQIAVAAARHPGLKVGVCFQNRYNPATVAIRELLTSGALGAVLGGSAHVLWRRTADYYRSRPWRGQRSRSGGGVLINQTIHTVDLLQWLLGPVASVRGDVGHYGTGTPDIDVEDTAHLVLEHGSGVRSLFYASTLNVADAPVVIDIATVQAVLHLEGDLTVTYADGHVETVVNAPTGATVGRSYWGTSHRLLIEDFYRHLSEPTPFWIDPAEALKTSSILAQVYGDPGGH